MQRELEGNIYYQYKESDDTIFSFDALYNIAYVIVNGLETLRWQKIETFILYGRRIATWFFIALFVAKLFVIFLFKNRLIHHMSISSMVG